MISNVIFLSTAVALATAAHAVTQNQPMPVGAPQPGLVTATVLPPGQQDERNPFSNLVFMPSRTETTVTVQTSPTPRVPESKIECGIKVIVVNPEIDPKMIITPPADAPEAKIRRIPPPPCPERDSSRK